MLRTIAAGALLIAVATPALAEEASAPPATGEAVAATVQTTPAPPTEAQKGTPLPPSLSGFSETYSGGGCMHSRPSPTS